MPLIQIPTGTGASVTGATSTDIQSAFAGEILMAAAANPANEQTVYNPVTEPRETILLHTTYLIDLPYGLDTIEGSGAVPGAQVLIDNPDATFVTDLTGLSVVVATDNIQATIINNNVGGALLAATGAGENSLQGLTGANQFITGIGGVDDVVLDGSYNKLTSNGNDAVNIAGPATVTAAAGGDDGIQLFTGATLAFLNGSSSPMQSVINGAPSTITDLVGSGSTSVTAGTGTEYYFVDTSAGNVTLNANPNAQTAITFVHDAAQSTANITVQNFSLNDYIAISGYSGANAVTSPTNGANSVLLLSDGSTVTFTGVPVTTLQAVVHNNSVA